MNKILLNLNNTLMIANSNLMKLHFSNRYAMSLLTDKLSDKQTKKAQE